MQQQNKNKWLVPLAVLIVLIGFLRGYIFGNVNWIYLTLVNGRMNGARYEFYFLLEWTPHQLVILKWCLTALFSALFFMLTYLFIQIAFQSKTCNRITIFSYAALAVAALFVYIIAVVTNTIPLLYGVVRTIMGIVQSFMPLMVLYLLFRFLPQTSQD